jgi:hypothetical protein
VFMFYYKDKSLMLAVMVLCVGVLNCSGVIASCSSLSGDEVALSPERGSIVDQTSAEVGIFPESSILTGGSQLSASLEESAEDSILSPIITAQSSNGLQRVLSQMNRTERHFESSMQATSIHTQVPRRLMQLHSTFNELKRKIHENDNPDVVDILFLLDANGKLQTLATMIFLDELGQKLRARSNIRMPGLDLELYAVVDMFVGAGTGVIPAAVAALGKPMDQSIQTLSETQTKYTIRKTLSSFLRCCWRACNTAETIVSAYYANPQEVVNDDDSDCDELKYDRLDFAEHADEGLLRIFDTDTKYDLRTGFEAIALKDDDSILEIVMNAIQVRDRDTGARLRRFHIGKVLGKAAEILALTPEESRGEYRDKVDNAVEAMRQLQFVTKKPEGTQGGSLSELRDSLISRTQIPRDVVVVNISADTFNGSVFVPSFGSAVNYLVGQKKIVNIDFKLAIPEYMYTPQNMAQSVSHVGTLQQEVRRLFADNLNSGITVATRLLTDFLNACNARVLDEIDTINSRSMASNEI